VDPCNTSPTLVSQESKPEPQLPPQSTPSPPSAPPIITSPRAPGLAWLLKAVSEPTYRGGGTGMDPWNTSLMLV
jgi:hypothetical protein